MQGRARGGGMNEGDNSQRTHAPPAPPPLPTDVPISCLTMEPFAGATTLEQVGV